jgi:hypothetical protein
VGTYQIGASVQNDGNFAHLDQYNPRSDIVKRIEVFRCSQPAGGYGITGVGSTAEAISGDDYLRPSSNRVHRSIYSEGQRGSRLTAIFEIREEFDPDGLPKGSWDVRVRDLDVRSATFGQVLHVIVQPNGSGSHLLAYAVRGVDREPALITSPLQTPIAELSDLPDLAADATQLGEPVNEIDPERIEIAIDATTTRSELDNAFDAVRPLITADRQRTWIANVQSYLRFGDLGPKSVHPGTNLAGDEEELVSEYLVWRKYRLSMMVLGRAFIDEMSGATVPFSGPLRSGESDAKPGVYSLYVLAETLGIQVYKLVLDKVYSDYGGIPMALAPGSRLETGAEPVADASAALRTAADLAHAFFLRE